jgi:hypothetical protein
MLRGSLVTDEDEVDETIGIEEGRRAHSGAGLKL